MSLKNIHFTTKLFIAIVFLSIISVVTIATNAIRMSHYGLNEIGKIAITKTHQTAVDSVRMYDKNTRWKLEGDLSFFKREIETKGEVELVASSMLKQQMVNQVTKATSTR